MPLRRGHEESIAKRIEFARVELLDLEPYEDLSYETYQTDRATRRNVEHAIENTMNVVIDIAKILLAGYQSEVPDTYRQTFLRMSEIRVTDIEHAQALSDQAQLRNMLGHRYLDYKWPYIKRFSSRDEQL